MEQTRESALAAFEAGLRRVDTRQRDPGAWEEGNLLGALVAITSGEYAVAVTRIDAAGRAPTAAEVSTIARRVLLTRAEIRDRLDDLLAERRRTRP
jgi:hypothetical protein